MEKIVGVRVVGPLAPYVGGFKDELRRLGYPSTSSSSAAHLRLLADLSRWLAEEGMDASGLTPATVDAFFAERRAAGCLGLRTGRALLPLVEYLRQMGVAPPTVPVVPATSVELLLVRYRDYLTVERGLAKTTAAVNVRLVRPFLLERARVSVEGRLDLGDLTAGEVNTFVVVQYRQRPRSVKRIVAALRSLLGFLHVDGTVGASLATAVPTVAGWTLTRLPGALEADQVVALLASCDRNTRTGCRDLAILTMLVRLGLRAGEVAALGLDDIDWRRGEVTVRGKGNRHDQLPLPVDVGQAVVDYLRDGRPETALGRTVFVRALAPHRALTSSGVTTIVVTAGQRAGIGPVGAHRLRHSAATAMLRAGGSLEEIGQVLRHRRPLTTAIYAKVDAEALRQLARPWPGVAA